MSLADGGRASLACQLSIKLAKFHFKSLFKVLIDISEPPNDDQTLKVYKNCVKTELSTTKKLILSLILKELII